jgi:hypothetical protein
MKKVCFSIVLFFSLLPIFAQNRDFDAAIKDFAKMLLPYNAGTIAVVTFETDKPELMVRFIDTMIENLLEGDRNVTVVERHKIEYILREQDISLTGHVSDETAQRIGHLIGADSVIYGSLERGSMGIKHRMSITATVTESGKILQQKTYTVQIEHDPHFWTVGVSVGSSFSSPLVIGTVHGTIAPFRYSFLELGADFGFVTRDPKVNSYYSILPFAHYAFFLPFGKGGWYAGTGIGYWHREQVKSGSINEPVRYRDITLDIITGFNIWNIIDISYTFRTNFTKAMNHKFAMGYTYRF